MSNVPEILAERIGPLVHPLHEAFERARHRLAVDYAGLATSDQDWLRTHAMRGLVYQELRGPVALPEPWRVTGNHRLNGMVNLTYSTGEITLRAVHKLGSSTPHAGGNQARRAFYTNQAIADMADSQMIETHRMLLCWDDPNREGPFELDIIRPLNAGSITKKVRADIAIPLPRSRTAFESLSFNTDDDAEELHYEIDIAGTQ
ncbi:MAG: hypothetical protein ACRDTI_01770 [Mycobacterium sp.]